MAVTKVCIRGYYRGKYSYHSGCMGGFASCCMSHRQSQLFSKLSMCIVHFLTTKNYLNIPPNVKTKNFNYFIVLKWLDKLFNLFNLLNLLTFNRFVSIYYLNYYNYKASSIYVRFFNMSYLRHPRIEQLLIRRI